MGFGHACAPVRWAHPSFELIATQNGALRAPPLPIAASLLLIRPSKIYKIYWAAHVKGFFLSTGPQRLWNMRSPAPRSAHRSFAYPSGNILRLKLCTGANICHTFFRFFFSIVFRSFLFVSLFFFISPFQFHLILVFLSFFSYLFLFFSQVLFFVFLFFSSYILNCLLYYRHAY